MVGCDVYAQWCSASSAWAAAGGSSGNSSISYYCSGADAYGGSTSASDIPAMLMYFHQRTSEILLFRPWLPKTTGEAREIRGLPYDRAGGGAGDGRGVEGMIGTRGRRAGGIALLGSSGDLPCCVIRFGPSPQRSFAATLHLSAQRPRPHLPANPFTPPCLVLGPPAYSSNLR
jgi:hypothetical protein